MKSKTLSNNDKKKKLLGYRIDTSFFSCCKYRKVCSQDYRYRTPNRLKKKKSTHCQHCDFFSPWLHCAMQRVVFAVKLFPKF